VSLPLALIPSPGSPVALQLGPVTIPWYGIGYAVALALGVWLTARLARSRGLDPLLVGDGFVLVVVCGLIGARLYHVIDQWAYYQDHLAQIVLPPYTGLALYGGVLGGLVGLIWFTRRRGQSAMRWADVTVPALMFGQAIARWGNYFNQELYGPPTNAPWGIAIDCAHRVAAYACPAYGPDQGFQPMFFYESSLDLLGGLIALFLLTRLTARLRHGDLLAFWLIWYGAVRTTLETMRLSYDFTFFGLPVAQILGVGAMIVGAAILIRNHRGPAPLPETGSAIPVAADPASDERKDAAGNAGAPAAGPSGPVR
jgi:phosphatidylglycerol:prolipoprotein diacylglycerol transferase